MKPMDHKKWQSWFRECQVADYFRRKLIFIDQVPHDKHNDLQEAIFANFCLPQMLIYAYNLCSYKDLSVGIMKRLGTKSLLTKNTLEKYSLVRL
jgi:hypothetical protein